MSQHATSDLDGTLLNLAVAIAAGKRWRFLDNPFAQCEEQEKLLQVYEEAEGVHQGFWTLYSPSRVWAEAGLLLVAEEISLSSRTFPVANADNGVSGCWSATTWHRGVSGRRSFEIHETSPLIAAMRCYVASKLGDTIELP